MTRQEALEYLNLPVNSSNALVRKRYLELHRDYQKAINNAPSEHFRTLYRENLDKIEEAYLIMKSSFPGLPKKQATVVTQDHKIQQTVKEAKELVNNFLTPANSHRPDLDKAAKTQILGYIDQITLLQDFLREEAGGTEPNGSSGFKEKVGEADLLTTVSTLPGILSQEKKVPSGIQIDSESLPQKARKGMVTEVDNGNVPNAESTSGKSTIEENPDTELHRKEEPSPDAHIMDGENNESGSGSKESAFRHKAVPSWQGSSMLDTLLHSGSSIQRNNIFNRMMLGTIFLIFSLGVAGFIYTFYPIIFPHPPEEVVTPPEISQETTEVSIQQIVGDEFFRTGDYLEALVQYTLAVSKNPTSTYLLNQIDSCKTLLSQFSPSELLQEEKTQASEPDRLSSSQTAGNVNSANRFRGDETVEPSPFAWNDWAQDSKSREQAINSARSARSSTDSTQEPSGDSANFLIPKSSGGNQEPAENNEIKNFVDEHPEPIGGYEKFTRQSVRKIRYPGEAVRANVSGMVIVQLIVHKDGSISDIKVVKGIGYGCDKEALRVVSLFSEWVPGKLNGEIVNARVVIPIYFKLPD